MLVSLACTCVDAAELADQWRQVAQYSFEGPHQVFAHAGGRESQLGEAVTLLNLQPRTSRNVDRAALLLESIASAIPGDDLGISARYLRARIEEVHRTEARPAEAARLYLELILTGGTHALAQQAAVRLSLLKLYSLTETTTPAQRIEEAEKLGGDLTDPIAIRDHALLVGQACLYYKQPLTRAQMHLGRALAAGVLNPTNRADLLVTLGEIGRELGDVPRSEQAYQSYLREAPRGDRASAVRRRLVELNELPISAPPRQ